MDTELEKKLLEQVMQSGDSESSLLELIDFYKQADVPEKAVPYLIKLFSNAEDVEKAAYFCIGMGAEMEYHEEYEQAIWFYSCGLSRQPQTTDILYFLNNNMGYSLIMIGRHTEAEGYCEKAIYLNPNRHNAFKNLGLSLQGQGRYAEAAENFMQAVRNCSVVFDPRALNHLEDLLLNHPEVMSEIDGIKEFLSEYEPKRKDRKLH